MHEMARLYDGDASDKWVRANDLADVIDEKAAMRQAAHDK